MKEGGEAESGANRGADEGTSRVKILMRCVQQMDDTFTHSAIWDHYFMAGVFPTSLGQLYVITAF